jgi:hypothetical protein
LNASANVRKFCRLLKQDDGNLVLRECKGGCYTANATADNKDGLSLQCRAPV